MLEAGEDFQEDITASEFNLVIVEYADEEQGEVVAKIREP